MRLAVALMLLTLALAGCTGTPPPPGGDGPGTGGSGGRGQAPPLLAEAPWWGVGDAYTVVIERPGAAATTWRMVNFWNDTETAHFWLGVQDRQQAMDMALFDTNPFLGRIHHAILTPHERGMHAAMYSFPLGDGKRWNGFFFDRNWTFQVEEAALQTPLGPDRGFAITGTSTGGDGHAIAYDYSPKLKWFTTLRETDRSGQPVLTATVTGYDRGATGTYTFLRGRDFYAGPVLPGTHEEPFEVREEVDALAFYVQARASGPLEVQLVDPSGRVVKRVAAATGGQASLFDEVAPATQGTWKVRYVATGAITGEVEATGLIDTTRTI